MTFDIQGGTNRDPFFNVYGADRNNGDQSIMDLLSSFNKGNFGGGPLDNNFLTRFTNSDTFGAINSAGSMFSNFANLYGTFADRKERRNSRRFQQDAFNKNFNAQAQAYNNQLRDKWFGRNQSNVARGRPTTSEADFLAGRQIQKA